MSLFQKKILNCISLFLIVFLLYIILRFNDLYYSFFNSVFYVKIFSLEINLQSWSLINWWFIFYFVSYLLYYLFFGTDFWKTFYFWRGIISIVTWKWILQNDKNAILNILVKIVFLPLMFFRFFMNLQSLINTIEGSINYLLYFNSFKDFYIRHLHWFLFNLIFFLDVAVFLFWYSVELKFLNNQIKSVEPTVLWWFVTLLCYPLLNQFTANVINWYSSDLPDFVKVFWPESIYGFLTVFWGIIFLISMWVYVRASLALGLRASNLTNRWIVSWGPYKFIRHPAYFCKNFARIVWALPVVLYYIKVGDIRTLFGVIASLIWWMTIYHLRAITEENHLWLDQDYLDYKKKVKYRYIPFIY